MVDLSSRAVHSHLPTAKFTLSRLRLGVEASLPPSPPLPPRPPPVQFDALSRVRALSASMSTVAAGGAFPPAAAIDLNMQTLCASSYPPKSAGEWLAIEIDQAARVDYVAAYNRLDAPAHQADLFPFEVYVGYSQADFSAAVRCGEAVTADAAMQGEHGAAGPFFVACPPAANEGLAASFVLPGRERRYVTLRQMGSRVRQLVVAELTAFTAFGSPPPPSPPPPRRSSPPPPPPSPPLPPPPPLPSLSPPLMASLRVPPPLASLRPPVLRLSSATATAARAGGESGDGTSRLEGSTPLLTLAVVAAVVTALAALGCCHARGRRWCQARSVPTHAPTVPVLAADEREGEDATARASAPPGRLPAKSSTKSSSLPRERRAAHAEKVAMLEAPAAAPRPAAGEQVGSRVPPRAKGAAKPSKKATARGGGFKRAAAEEELVLDMDL